MDEPLKYYFDEDVRRGGAVANELRRRGINVLTTPEAARASQRVPDDDQLEFASQNDRVIVTQDRRFIPTPPHRGMIVMRSVPFQEYADFLELVARVYSTEEMENQVIYFS